MKPAVLSKQMLVNVLHLLVVLFGLQRREKIERRQTVLETELKLCKFVPI